MISIALIVSLNLFTSVVTSVVYDNPCAFALNVTNATATSVPVAVTNASISVTATFTAFAGAPVSANVSASCISYSWVFSDGSIANGSQVTHTFEVNQPLFDTHATTPAYYGVVKMSNVNSSINITVPLSRFQYAEGVNPMFAPQITANWSLGIDSTQSNLTLEWIRGGVPPQSAVGALSIATLLGALPAPSGNGTWTLRNRVVSVTQGSTPSTLHVGLVAVNISDVVGAVDIDLPDLVGMATVGSMLNARLNDLPNSHCSAYASYENGLLQGSENCVFAVQLPQGIETVFAETLTLGLKFPFKWKHDWWHGTTFLSIGLAGDFSATLHTVLNIGYYLYTDHGQVFNRYLGAFWIPDTPIVFLPYVAGDATLGVGLNPGNDLYDTLYTSFGVGAQFSGSFGFQFSNSSGISFQSSGSAQELHVPWRDPFMTGAYCTAYIQITGTINFGITLDTLAALQVGIQLAEDVSFLEPMPQCTEKWTGLLNNTGTLNIVTSAKLLDNYTVLPHTFWTKVLKEKTSCIDGIQLLDCG